MTPFEGGNFVLIDAWPLVEVEVATMMQFLMQTVLRLWLIQGLVDNKLESPEKLQPQVDPWKMQLKFPRFRPDALLKHKTSDLLFSLSIEPCPLKLLIYNNQSNSSVGTTIVPIRKKKQLKKKFLAHWKTLQPVLLFWVAILKQLPKKMKL